jgi:hypothetical protein
MLAAKTNAGFPQSDTDGAATGPGSAIHRGLVSGRWFHVWSTRHRSRAVRSGLWRRHWRTSQMRWTSLGTYLGSEDQSYPVQVSTRPRQLHFGGLSGPELAPARFD